MNNSQENHLKAYGVMYNALKKGMTGEWLLNYKGGSFIIQQDPDISQLAALRGVSYIIINEGDKQNILNTIKMANMESIKLEKAPKIAIYTPNDKNPWADAVTIALTYAEIPYDTLWDTEVLADKLLEYDWLHLHHEDFTGQYSKFYSGYQHTAWMKQKRSLYEKIAAEAGYKSVQQHKTAVALKIKEYVKQGGFMFAMCTATETIDIALACEGIDIVPKEIDGTAYANDWKNKIDYSKTFAFYNFDILIPDNIPVFSDIDFNWVNYRQYKKETEDFILFEFSAKIDPIPTLLNQNHKNRINGFYGQTTTFRTEKIKDGVVILARSAGSGSVRYLHGNYEEGTYTFYGGHDPEDKNHVIGDKPTDLNLYKNSPGYRLILNNILFPSAKPKEKKT